VSRVVQLTDSAREYLKQVGQPNVYLSVKGGGCSGFQYVWEVTEKEPTVENLVIDPVAEMFVLGCTVDYVTELDYSLLKMNHPTL
jgi:Fe-S cluster assembly iron-binding protein IscA